MEYPDMYEGFGVLLPTLDEPEATLTPIAR